MIAHHQAGPFVPDDDRLAALLSPVLDTGLRH